MIDVFAHRGLHRTERENTLDAFTAAVSLGVDGVEMDVRRTIDGVLVVHHDPRVESMAIAQTRRSALPTYVPTLVEALECLVGVSVNVEIKNGRGPGETYDESGDLARQTLRVIADAGWRHRVSISCFDLATCALVRSEDRDVNVAWLLWDVAIGDALVRAHVLGLNAVNPHFSTVNADVLQRAADLALDVNVWTVNAEADLEKMCAIGVASIITDDPALARAVVRRTAPNSDLA